MPPVGVKICHILRVAQDIRSCLGWQGIYKMQSYKVAIFDSDRWSWKMVIVCQKIGHCPVDIDLSHFDIQLNLHYAGGGTEINHLRRVFKQTSRRWINDRVSPWMHHCFRPVGSQAEPPSNQAQ